MDRRFKLAVCQMEVIDNKAVNINKAIDLLGTSKKNGADLAVLPEMFNCPYENNKFGVYAESEEDGETIKRISETAKELDMYVIAGSIPEKSENRLYNTCFIFNRQGKLIGKHRKVHLFDIDIKSKICFKESDTLSPGENTTIVDTEFCKIGIAICYDIRFPELMRIMALKGAELFVIPAAFNMVSGPAHWEALARIRAVDNQVFLSMVSPARNENSSYIAYGNSMVVDPWGNIISSADEKERIIYADIDLNIVDKIREELPLLKHRRTDLYDIALFDLK